MTSLQIKNKISEVQNYFTEKIQSRNYILKFSEMQIDGWMKTNIQIDEFDFNFSSKDEMLCMHETPIAFSREQKKLILQSIEYLMQDVKQKSIQVLKERITELESKI